MSKCYLNSCVAVSCEEIVAKKTCENSGIDLIYRRKKRSPTCPQISQCHSKHENQRVPKRLCLGCWKSSQLQKLWRAPEKNGPVMTTVLLYKHRNQQVRTRSIFPISASRNPARVLLVFQWQADKGKTERESPWKDRARGSIWIASKSHLHRIIPM